MCGLPRAIVAAFVKKAETRWLCRPDGCRILRGFVQGEMHHTALGTGPEFLGRVDLVWYTASSRFCLVS
jgi:hypothetical protein